MSALSQSEKKKLKGLAHHLKPVVHVGKEGISDAVIGTINKALNDHELIKVQFLETAFLDRKLDSVHLAEIVHAELIQVIGHKIVLYRKNEEKDKQENIES